MCLSYLANFQKATLNSFISLWIQFKKSLDEIFKINSQTKKDKIATTKNLRLLSKNGTKVHIHWTSSLP